MIFFKNFIDFFKFWFGVAKIILIFAIDSLGRVPRGFEEEIYSALKFYS